MASNEPKRQHSVPEMLQLRFSNDRGKLWFFDKRRPNNGANETSPTNLFVQNRQYTLRKDDGTRNWSLEERYSRIEGYMDVLIDKIVPPVLSGRLPALSESERRLIDLFVYEQWRRVPELHRQLMSDNQFEAIVQESIATYEREHRKLDEVEKAKYKTEDFLKRERHNLRVISLSRTTGLALDALAAKGLCFARTGQSRSFVLGSFPVVKFTPLGQTRLDAPEVEVWLAIHPNVAVVLAGRSDFLAGISLQPAAIRAINRSVVRQSDSFAGRDRALIIALAKPFVDRLLHHSP